MVCIGRDRWQDHTVYGPTRGSGSLLLKDTDESLPAITIYGQEKDNATPTLPLRHPSTRQSSSSLAAQTRRGPASLSSAGYHDGVVPRRQATPRRHRHPHYWRGANGSHVRSTDHPREVSAPVQHLNPHLLPSLRCSKHHWRGRVLLYAIAAASSRYRAHSSSLQAGAVSWESP